MLERCAQKLGAIVSLDFVMHFVASVALDSSQPSQGSGYSCAKC